MSGEQVRVETTNVIMESAASWWVRFLRPIPYDRVFNIGGIRVRVRVDQYRRADDTKPVFGVRDEDNQIED
jgi:5-carboxymethyl-2-hydroxymuconate isomerase